MRNGSTAMSQSLNKLNSQHYFESHTALQKQLEAAQIRFLKKLLSITRQEKQRNAENRGEKAKSGQYSR